MYSAFFKEFSRQFYITFIKNSRYQLFLIGLRNTLIIAVCAVLLGTAIGILVALVRVHHTQTGRLKLLDKLMGAYLAFFRGTPILIQLAIMYYIIFKSFDNALVVAILGFSINSGAYVAEIVRAGILAVDIGQSEAGRSLGLSNVQTMRLIILPQAIKNILPALGNEFIALIKETSIAGFITITELTRAGDLVRSSTMQPYFPLFSVAIIYFVIVQALTKLLNVLERRMRKSDRH